MLKIIATDMDGTLLNNQKELPEKTFNIIDRIHQKGITFAVASGREYSSLINIYKEIADKIVIISDNGARITYNGEMIFHDIMSKDDINEIMSAINKHSDLKLTVCGLKSTYMFEENVLSDMSNDLIKSYFPNRTIIKNLSDLPADEKIIKIAIFDPQGNSRENIYEHLKHLEHKYQLAISGVEWMDIMNLGINKGMAIQKLQEKLGAAKEETMVFGDALNDYEMMQQAYYSYAMANAVPEVREVSNFTAPSNEEQGVIRILENFLAMIK